MGDGGYDLHIWLKGIPEPVVLYFTSYERAANCRDHVDTCATNVEPPGYLNDDFGRSFGFRIKELNAMLLVPA